MKPRSIAIANRHPRLRLDRRAVVRALARLDAEAPSFEIREPSFLSGELSLVFLTDADLAQLHDQFLDDPTLTDVITFEGDPTAGVAGEICVSVDAALRHIGVDPASRRTIPATRLADFSAELSLYLVHGWLHLAGYDDLQPAKKRVMRRAEARAMKLLRTAPSVLPRFTLRK